MCERERERVKKKDRGAIEITPGMLWNLSRSPQREGKRSNEIRGAPFCQRERSKVTRARESESERERDIDNQSENIEHRQSLNPRLPIEVEVHVEEACEDHGDVDLDGRRGVLVASGKEPARSHPLLVQPRWDAPTTHHFRLHSSILNTTS